MHLQTYRLRSARMAIPDSKVLGLGKLSSCPRNILRHDGSLDRQNDFHGFETL